MVLRYRKFNISKFLLGVIFCLEIVASAAIDLTENYIIATDYCKPSDNIDDAQGLREALDVSVKEGKPVWLPDGVYDLEENTIIEIPQKASMLGDPNGLAIIKTDSFGAEIIFGKQSALKDVFLMNIAIKLSNNADAKLINCVLLSHKHHSAHSVRSNKSRGAVVENNIFLRGRDAYQTGLSSYRSRDLSVKHNIMGLDLANFKWIITEWDANDIDWRQRMFVRLNHFIRLQKIERTGYGCFNRGINLNEDRNIKVVGNILNFDPRYYEEIVSLYGRLKEEKDAQDPADFFGINKFYDHVIYAIQQEDLLLAQNFFRGQPSNPGGGLKIRNTMGFTTIVANHCIDVPVLAMAYDFTEPFAFANSLILDNYIESRTDWRRDTISFYAPRSNTKILVTGNNHVYGNSIRYTFPTTKSLGGDFIYYSNNIYHDSMEKIRTNEVLVDDAPPDEIISKIENARKLYPFKEIINIPNYPGKPLVVIPKSPEWVWNNRNKDFKLPSSLTAKVVSRTAIELNWKDNSNDETGFRIERKTPTNMTWTELAEVDANTTMYVDSTVSWGHDWDFRVLAFNANGNEAVSNVAGGSVKVPNNPTNLKILQYFNSNSVVLSWDDNSEGESGFTVERSSSVGFWEEVGTTGPNATEFYDTNLSPGIVHTYRVRALSPVGNSGNSEVAAHSIPQNFSTSKPVNISTRGMIGSGNEIMIAGFIITGTESMDIYIRGVGKSINLGNNVEILQDPQITLNDSDGYVLASNDNWQESPNLQAIKDTDIPPTDPHESAIHTNLPPGAYTVFMQGKGKKTGLGIIEVYSAIPANGSEFINISTRGLVGKGDAAMISGIIVQGSENITLYLRAQGPTLPAEIGNLLADPILELYEFPSGNLIYSNDDWVDSDLAASIIATTIPPSSPREPAILLNLPPRSYTAVLRGVGNTEGVAILEILQIQDNP